MKVEWNAIDESAAREGAALLRLQRRTGARLIPVPPEPVRHIRYDRASAIEAFDRLFRGELLRSDLPATYEDRRRRAVARTAREADRRMGATLGGLSRDMIRRRFAEMRGAA